jgi:CTP:molybdopterin cytidylyltransferase MocA
MTGTDPHGKKCSVLVLAGSRGSSDPVAEFSDSSAKAFAGIAGTPMIERVLTTLIASDKFSCIFVSLTDQQAVEQEAPQLHRWRKEGRVILVASAASPSASVLQVLESLDNNQRLVVTTADHPLLTTESVVEFVDAFSSSDAGAVAALTSTDAICACYPGMRRTAMRFSDGNLSGCNLFGFAAMSGVPVVRFWRQLEQHRKNPLRVVSFLGIGTLLRYRFHRLSLDAALAQLTRKTGVKLQAIRLSDPHMGIDVDSVADLKLVTAIIESR